jgi:hypothetical protein
MLAVSGRLDPALFGPSINLDAASNSRRTFYAAISRHDLAWMLRLFDFPDPNITSSGRTITTVPLQGLYELNSEFMLDNAQAVTARLQTGAATQESPDDHDASQIRQAYRLILGRAPNDREFKLGLAYLHGPSDGTSISPGARNVPSRWQRYTHALLASNEFAFVD